MNAKELLEYYVEQSNRLHTNTWQGIHALFPNLDIDFSIHSPKERKVVSDHESFLITLPKVTEVVMDEAQLNDYYGMCVYLYLPENSDKEFWSKQIELQNCDDCRFILNDERSINI
jgi:hypothetical protein